MTNENMIKQLKRLIPSLQYADDVNAVKGAIKALSQEPCDEIDFVQPHKKIPVTLDLTPSDDVISREAVLQAVSEGCQEWRGIYGRCEELINALPPVTPKPIECDDAISREAAITIAGTHTLTVDETVKALERLPSVTQKSGKWILTIEDWNKWTCSNCGYVKRTDIHVNIGWKYCPNCGAKMESEG